MSATAARSRRRRLRVLTWHVHSRYLYHLAQVPHDFWLVTDASRSRYRSGRSGPLPWPDNVHEARVEQLATMAFDVVLYPSRHAWDLERHEVLSVAQRALPRIVLEHDPPPGPGADTPHWCDDPGALLVHVTPFQALMWDNGQVPVRVVEHGVQPLVQRLWTGDLPQGLVVVDHMRQRGRCVGLDLWQGLSAQVPLSLVGARSEAVGGQGEVSPCHLPELLAWYRFFFNPVRHGSLGLTVIEAMMAGLPVVGLATGELPTVIDNGRNGFIDTRPERLVGVMRQLLRDRSLAEEWGQAGRRTARERFAIGRFVDDWLAVFDEVAG